MTKNYTSQQITNYDGFPKAAELIEITGAHALEASDRAIFNHLLKIAHDSTRLLDPAAEWEVKLADLRRSCSRHESNDRIRDSIKRIRQTTVKVTYLHPVTKRYRILDTNLLEFTDTDVDVESRDATLQYGIPKRLRQILVNSNRWGRIKCEISYAMTSKYAIALYELICLRSNLNNFIEIMSVVKFRELLGVPPATYERGNDFEKRVVEPALLEVNALSNMTVDIAVRRKHSRAKPHEVGISWRRKSADELRETQAERKLGKAGRAHRLAQKKEGAQLVLI